MSPDPRWKSVALDLEIPTDYSDKTFTSKLPVSVQTGKRITDVDENVLLCMGLSNFIPV